MEKMIELKNITKKYGRRKALEDLTLSLPQGKIIGLVGENGSGKTTLLKLIAGLLTPDSGSATFSGSHITRKSGNEYCLYARCGFVLSVFYSESAIRFL